MWRAIIVQGILKKKKKKRISVCGLSSFGNYKVKTVWYPAANSEKTVHVWLDS